ncbi:MAG TPA: metal ABC transporter permease [Chthoniobacteraceae bacterium]|jgi:zinc/manganese transport system permease protein|nr:metal ABC transporter permease [Chthoniobacteraceae bacterium]
MIDHLREFLSYDFVRSALMAGSLAAVLAAVVGYFVVLRKVEFAAHALAHIGFTGATGAALFALSPLEGMLIISVAAGATMGVMGNRLHRSEIAIGMVLSVCLGVGTLFLTLYQGFAGQASAILFGNIFGVSSRQIVQIGLLSVGSLAVLFVYSRKLIFSSIQPDLAEARGVSLTVLSLVFMVILAVSVTLASQVVGILLVFTLIIGPAGIAARLFRGFWSGTLASIGLALVAVWLGILLACATNWPPSFWITVLLFVPYVVVEMLCRFVFKVER